MVFAQPRNKDDVYSEKDWPAMFFEKTLFPKNTLVLCIQSLLYYSHTPNSACFAMELGGRHGN